VSIITARQPELRETGKREYFMRRHIHFWYLILTRGFLAILAGCGALVLPDMARTLLLLPIAVAISILVLGVYGTVDSALAFVSSFIVEQPQTRRLLRLQGIVGIAVGIVLLTVAYSHVRLEWFLVLIALQLLAVAAGETGVAMHAHSHTPSIWNYAGAVTALLFAIAYLVAGLHFADVLSPRQIALLIYYYLLVFGVTQCLIAARMLYSESHATCISAT
jgi:uncharacterized membrane protein HdeD (DUF308 family)